MMSSTDFDNNEYFRNSKVCIYNSSNMVVRMSHFRYAITNQVINFLQYRSVVFTKYNIETTLLRQRSLVVSY